MTAIEEERLADPGVWCGHKGKRPAGISKRSVGWNLDYVKEGSYVCFQPTDEENSLGEYLKHPGFGVARVGRLPPNEELTDESRLFVVFQQFDP